AKDFAYLIFECVWCCGGGGGGGASLPDSEYTTHNPHGWGGGGNGGGTNGGSNGGNTSVTLQGGTPLIVTGYTFNNTTYPDLTSLTLAMTAADATAPQVTFTVAGESTTRTARVTKTSSGYKVEHQYKATYYVSDPMGTNATELFYYADNGFDISADTGSNVDGWQDSNGGYHNGGVISGVSGDITLTQVLKGTDFNIEPAKPSSASEIVSGITYKLTNTTDLFTFTASPSVSGESFPSGATFTWTINNGTPVTNTTGNISISPDDLGTISKRRSSATPINVHCVVTKEGIATKTSEKTIMVYNPLVMPDAFDIADDTYQPPTNTTYRVVNLSDTLYFTHFMAGGSFPVTGTTYEWKVNGTTVATGSNDYCNISAIAMGYTASNIPKSESDASNITKTITCRASNPDAETSSNTTYVEATLNINVWQLSIPNGTVTVAQPSTVTTETVGGQTVYKINNMSGSFTVTANGEGGASFPTNSNFVWTIAKVSGGSYGPIVTDTPSFDIDLANTTLATALEITENDISSNSANPTKLNVNCTVKHNDLPESEWKTCPTETIKIYRPMFPDFSIGISDNGDMPSRVAGGNTVYTVRQSDIFSNKGIRFTATPADGQSFRADTTFEWNIESIGLTGDTRVISPTFTSMGVSSAPTSQTEYTVKCKAKKGSDESTLITETLRLAPPIKLDPHPTYIVVNGVDKQTGNPGFLLVYGSPSDDASKSVYVCDQESNEILEAAQATFYWYLGRSNTNSQSDVQANLLQLGSVPWSTDNADGTYSITIADLKNLFGGYSYFNIFLKVVPGDLNYDESEIKPAYGSSPLSTTVQYDP
ncbi:MAG: hypothetical protein J5597_07730, partial [Spirochaetaceae bacterium]|nr:hypothetical protein [Spirochaetaceae bacterium]